MKEWIKKLRHLPTSLLALSVGMLPLAGCAAQASVTAWPLATASPEDTVTQLYAEKFAEEVERLSNGAMKIDVYPNSTLGGDRDLLESCADGDIPFVVQNTAPQVSFMSDLAVFDLPCVFESIGQCRQTIDDEQFQNSLEQVYQDGGYRLLGIADQGFRVMSTSKKIEDFSDFAGQKIRTMENSYHMDFWKSLQASPTPMSFSEVYIGLQQHTIDAQENPYEVVVSNRLYEQQDYMIETNHLPHLITLITNDEFYSQFSLDQQKIIDQAARTATEYARAQSDQRIAERIAIIEEGGSEIVELSDEIRTQMNEAAANVCAKIQGQISPELFEAYTKNLN